jgi:hypothetical protein
MDNWWHLDKKPRICTPKKNDTSLEYYERFKMALYDRNTYEEKDEHDEMYLTAANGNKRKCSQVLAQAFKYLKDHIMQELRNTKTIETCEDVQWIVTVPAIWSNTAKARMRQAAIEAELINEDIPDHLMIAFEPECGSVVARRFCPDLKENDKYILLDLGGGTADIACHRVWDSFTVSQIYAPSGGPWGSTYIDEAFWNLLCCIFPRDCMNQFKQTRSNQFIQLKENFRKAKHQYNPKVGLMDTPTICIDDVIEFLEDCDVDMEKACTMVKEYALDGKSNVFQLDQDTAMFSLGHVGWIYLIHTVLDPLIAHVKMLFTRSELTGCQTMLCVGGLASSPYVMQRLRDVFVKELSVIKTLVKPDKPVLAVVEGAARFALSPSLIAEYVIPHTYGVKSARVWEEADGDEYKLWSQEDESFVFQNGFQIFVRNSAKLSVHDPPKVQYFQPVNKDDQEITISIHRTSDPSPTRCTDDTFCAQGTFQLPSDWRDKDPSDKVITVAFFFNKM